MAHIEAGKSFLTPVRLLLAVIAVIVLWNLSGLF